MSYSYIEVHTLFLGTSGRGDQIRLGIPVHVPCLAITFATRIMKKVNASLYSSVSYGKWHYIVVLPIYEEREREDKLNTRGACTIIVH